MKRIVAIFLLVIAAVLPVSALAADVNFYPRDVAIKVTAGKTGSVPLMVLGFAGEPYSLYLRVGSVIQSGNVPSGWLTPAYISLTSSTGGRSLSSFDLIVSVPEDAVAGIYSGVLLPENFRGPESLSSTGFMLNIEVTPQSACSGLPVFADVIVGPQEIWAPSDRDVAVTIAGTLSVAPGCEVAAGYELESNDGLLEGEIEVGPGGRFSETVVASLSRSGRDKDGRVFNGSLFAMDVDGNEASVDFQVTVLHDMGKKNGRNK